jgi:hypothetical protein
MIAAGSAPRQYLIPPFLPTPSGIINVIPAPVVQATATPSYPEGIGVAAPAYASLNVYPRNGYDSSNYFSDVCPTCGNVHHLSSLAPFTCHSGTGATAGWPGTAYLPQIAYNTDLPSGDFVWLDYFKNLFVGIGSDFCSYSFDGQIWARANMPMGQWQTVTHGTTLFVAGGYNQWYDGIVATSPDGINWTQGTLPAGTGPLQYIIWSGAQFVAVGATWPGASVGTCLTSPDGLTWTKRTIPAGPWGSVCYNASNLYIALTYDGLQCITSADGITWTTRTAPGGAPQDIVWNGSAFVVVGYSSFCKTTTDGITWTNKTIAAGDYIAIRHDGTNHVACGVNVLATSTDATTWGAQTIGSGIYFDSNYRAAPAYTFVTVGFSCIAAMSTNRTAWTKTIPVGGWEVLKQNKVIES